MEQGRWTSAETLLANAVACCPKDPEARRHHADALWKLNRRDEAVAQLEQTAAILPDDAALRVRLAQMRLAMNQSEKARAEIDAALDIEPANGSAWAMRARARRATSDAVGALADYHRALGFVPEDRDLLLETAELYRELNQPEKALALLHRLADTYAPGEEPQNVIYLEGLACAALGRWDEAADKYAAALARGKPTPELYCQLAELRRRAGRSAEAASAVAEALRLQPDHGPSCRLYEEIAGRPPGVEPCRR